MVHLKKFYHYFQHLIFSTFFSIFSQNAKNGCKIFCGAHGAQFFFQQKKGFRRPLDIEVPISGFQRNSLHLVKFRKNNGVLPHFFIFLNKIHQKFPAVQAKIKVLKEVVILVRFEFQLSVDHIFTIPLRSGCGFVFHITKKIFICIFDLVFGKIDFLSVFFF